MSRGGLWTSQLVYGAPGAGKSHYCISAFWDFKQNKAIRDGVLLTFGREDSALYGLPSSMVRTFSVPALDNMTWFADFTEYCDRLAQEAQAGRHKDVIVIDGLSEFDLLYEEAYTNVYDSKDKFAKFEALMSDTLGLMQRLDPRILGAHVLATARITDKRKSRQSRNVTLPGDPDWVEAEHFPAFRGKFRYELGHYFDFLFFVDSETALHAETGQRRPVHILHTIRTGDYLIKNRLEEKWLDAGKPTEFTNATFDAVYKVIEELTGGAAAKVG